MTPGQLCSPPGSGRGCWVGRVGAAAGGVPATSDSPLASRIA